MKRRILMFLLIFVAFFLQCSVLQAVSVATISPNLLLVLTVSFALMRGKREGIFVGFLGGLLTDLFSGGVLGFHALLYAWVGFLTGFCCRIFYDDDIKMPVLLVCASDLAVNLAEYLFRFLLRGRMDFFFYLGRIIIPEIIYTAILTILCYRLLFLLNRWLEKAEKRSVDSFV